MIKIESFQISCKSKIVWHFVYTHLLVSRLISEKFVEIHLELPDISPVLEWGGLSQEGVTNSNFFFNMQHSS